MGDRLRDAQAEMRIGLGSRHATASRAHEEALLNEERLEHVFNGAALFAQSRRKVVDADRATRKLLDDGEQQAAVLRSSAAEATESVMRPSAFTSA